MMLKKQECCPVDEAGPSSESLLVEVAVVVMMVSTSAAARKASKQSAYPHIYSRHDLYVECKTSTTHSHLTEDFVLGTTPTPCRDGGCSSLIRWCVAIETPMKADVHYDLKKCICFMTFSYG
jgi:hypothetical protein